MLKTYWINSIDLLRLSNLAVMFINSDMLKDIEIEEILEKFANIQQSRLKFSC